MDIKREGSEGGKRGQNKSLLLQDNGNSKQLKITKEINFDMQIMKIVFCQAMKPTEPSAEQWKIQNGSIKLKHLWED